MKRTLFTAALLLPLLSCSLKEPDDLFVSPGFVETLQQADACVTATYSPLNPVYALGFAIATEGCTDLFYIQSGTQDAQMDVSPANARFGNTVWEYAYAGIRNANYAIWAMDRSDIDPADLAPLYAEAKAMRAYWFYILTSFFGDVPYYEDYVGDRPTLDKVRHLPRMSAVQTRETLIAQLEACVDDLPRGRSYDLGLQRAGWAFTRMLMAKMAMWNACKDESRAAEWWAKAASSLEALQEVYGDLTEEAYPLDDTAFRIKDTPESIFEIQHTYTPGGLQYFSNYAAVLMPYPLSKDAAGNCTFNGVKVDELGTECIVWQPMRPNAYLANGLFINGGRDRRVGRSIVYSWDGSSFSRSWPGPKFWCYDMINTYDSNNYPVFRYADAVLMLAETYNALDRPDEAMALLNSVKTRAGLSGVESFTTKDRLLDEIQMERGRELLGEFQRKFDLVRWGIWFKRTYEFSDYQVLKDNLRPCHEYYPIPDTEVALSEGALDNKAYEE
ncbi:MAG: RagB/SusD family nutrient uptake outer membrane protein [Bacteroidales bacterium]|nr:RagB/SusD family nutrient uptake outer membrane protein [Bacteroidales bacterium]